MQAALLILNDVVSCEGGEIPSLFRITATIESKAVRPVRDAATAARNVLRKERDAAREAVRVLQEALKSVAGNSRACTGAFELEMREAVGNTNYNCLEQSITKADAALAATEGVV